MGERWGCVELIESENESLSKDCCPDYHKTLECSLYRMAHSVVEQNRKSSYDLSDVARMNFRIAAPTFL
jgi:hypothetical protein